MNDPRKYHGIPNTEKTEAKESYNSPGLAIQTDGKIKRNTEDTVVKDYKRKTYLLIDMSVPTNNNDYRQRIQKAK